MITRILYLALSLGSLFGGYFLVARPWFHGWGATAAERAAVLPGDELVPRAADSTTRAISIHAPATRVWQWVAQLGQDRGGFYSYDMLENLVGCEMPRLETLAPHLQRWQVGDKLWMYPPDKLDGFGGAPLRLLREGRLLAFATRQIGTPTTAPEDGSWTFVVQPTDEAATRLIVRGRGAGGQGALARLISVLVFEPAHFVMERRMLLGIAALSEGRHISFASDAAQVMTWTIAFLLFLMSGVRVLIDATPRKQAFRFVGAGATFAFLTFTQPPLLVGFTGVALLVAVMFFPKGGGREISVVRAATAGSP